jgi:type I restriction enzyme M protein
MLMSILMTMYASNAGKSGGEFFTPQEVGELLSQEYVLEIKHQLIKYMIHACGSGGLLLKIC